MNTFSSILEKVDFTMFFRRLASFGVVGVAATLTHSLSVIFLVEVALLGPVIATVIAFLIAVTVSYGGNRYWVFNDRVSDRWVWLRFATVSVTSFLLNVGSMYAIVDIFGWSYLWGVLIAVIIVPILTFVMHNNWSFSNGGCSGQ